MVRLTIAVGDTGRLHDLLRHGRHLPLPHGTQRRAVAAAGTGPEVAVGLAGLADDLARAILDRASRRDVRASPALQLIARGYGDAQTAHQVISGAGVIGDALDWLRRIAGDRGLAPDIRAAAIERMLCAGVAPSATRTDAAELGDTPQTRRALVEHGDAPELAAALSPPDLDAAELDELAAALLAGTSRRDGGEDAVARQLWLDHPAASAARRYNDVATPDSAGAADGFAATLATVSRLAETSCTSPEHTRLLESLAVDWDGDAADLTDTVERLTAHR